MAVPLGSLHGELGRSSQSHQSLFELLPSTWWAAVAVPQRKSPGNLSSLIAGQHNETGPAIQAGSTRRSGREILPIQTMQFGFRRVCRLSGRRVFDGGSIDRLRRELPVVPWTRFPRSNRPAVLVAHRDPLDLAWRQY